MNAQARIAGIPLAGIGAALPDLALAGVFLAIWISPDWFHGKIVAWCLVIMLLEFFIVHSAGFTGILLTSRQSPQRKLTGMLGLGAFYTLMVGAFALSFGAWWPLVSFWLLMLNRMLGGLFAGATTPEHRMFVMSSWASSVFFYVVLVFVTLIAPIPPLGITRDVIAAQAFDGGGVWIEEPWRVVALGCFYFFATGVMEILLERWRHGAPASASEPSE